MTDDKKSKILEKVRALMAKAAGTTFPEEAKAFQAKADELMTVYAIESWQVDAAQAGIEARPQPEVRWMDFKWWRGNPFRDQLWWMFREVGCHCRCKVVTSKEDYSYGGEPGNYRMPVIGLPSDLDWFDLLFTNLMIAMIQKVDPQPIADRSVDENMAMMREAGLPWADALNRLALAGLVPSIAAEEAQRAADEDGVEVDFHDDDKFRYTGRGSGMKRCFFSKKVYERTITAYRKWCAETEHPQSYVSQATFRRNFANGFAAEINERLWRMAGESRRAYDETHESGSMEVAIRDIRVVIDEMMYAEWPDLRPHPPTCDCDDCHRCQNPNCKRPRCVAARKPIRVRRGAAPREKIDEAARQAGREAGSRVSLSNKPSERIGGNRPGLPGGN